MENRQLGKSGFKSFPLAFGAMRLPQTDPKDPLSIDADQSITMIRKAIDGGVNYIDTAWSYHTASREAPGESEPLVAQALKGGYREKVALATKLPTWLVTERKEMDYFLDAQLKRLDTHYIDFYLAHNLNNMVWPQMVELGLFDFLDKAQKDGRIKYPSFSFHDRFELFEEIMNSYDWIMAQIQYNYLDYDYQAGHRGLALAAERGVAVAIMEPLRGGFLINQLPPEMKEMLSAIRPEWSLADWALRWLWNDPRIGVVLSGMSSLEQVLENVKIANNCEPLNETEEKAVTEVRNFLKARLKINCTSCGYCLPCPQGVSIPKNFEYFNDYSMTDLDIYQKRAKYFHSVQVAKHEGAHNCIECGVCEERCPQSISIGQWMKEVATVFPA